MTEIKKHIENLNKKRIIRDFFIFPQSGSAWVTFKGGKTEYVPEYIWNRETRKKNSILETWQTIQSFSETKYEPSPIMPVPPFCPKCDSDLEGEEKIYMNEYGYKHCSNCHQEFIGTRYFIDPLTFAVREEQR